MELNISDLESKFELPLSVEAAVSALSVKEGKAVLVAGGTWLMRRPLRGETTDRIFVSLANIHELHRISVDDNFMHLGALATHQAIAEVAASLPEMSALAQAAAQSANPAIRRMATLGGNICARGFAAADIVPALIAMQATVSVQSKDGTTTIEIEDYIQTRANRPFGEILTKVSIPRKQGASAHARGLLRQAGEYSIANLSAYAELDSNGLIESARIAVGAVEAMPKRWRSLERVLQGQPFNKIPCVELAQSCMAGFTPRHGVDAPGWYRLRILPRLVERAFADVATQLEKGA